MAATEEEEFRDQESLYFDTVIGCIEDIIISEEFAAIQHDFFGQYCMLFDQGEENKLIYMEIFKEYTTLIELFLETRLIAQLPNFKMDQFLEDLRKRKHLLEGQVFEILAVLTDFLSFKETILDFKLAKEGKVNDLMLCGSGLKMRK